MLIVEISPLLMDLPQDAVTAIDVAKQLGMTRQQVSSLCRQDVFPGAVKLPGVHGPWLIPRASIGAYAIWREGRAGRKPKGPPRRRRR